MYIKARATAFAITALLAYLFSSIENRAGIVSQMASAFKEQAPNLPYLEWAIAGPLFVIALRLYFQAWAVDESVLIVRLREQAGLSKSRGIVEFGLRGAWIVLTMYFPFILSKGHIETPILGWEISWQVWLVAIFFSIVAWDLLLKKSVMALAKCESESQKSEFYWLWIYSDFALGICSLIMTLVLIFDKTLWKLIIFFTMLSLIIAICGIQVVYFFADMRKHQLRCQLEKRA